MIQKHDMVADFEKLTYDATMLKDIWIEVRRSAKKLVDAGWTSHHILTFIDWTN